jgi:uncharacterized DUF497 family protein
MIFEWDELKNELNIDKHGFDFADAYQIFDLPMLVTLMSAATMVKIDGSGLDY